MTLDHIVSTFVLAAIDIFVALVATMTSSQMTASLLISVSTHGITRITERILTKLGTDVMRLVSTLKIVILFFFNRQFDCDGS